MKTAIEIAEMEYQLEKLRDELAAVYITKERYGTADGIKKAAAELVENFYQMTPEQREIICSTAIQFTKRLHE